jgi:hypothetical protein
MGGEGGNMTTDTMHEPLIVEVLSPGEWNGYPVTTETLEQLAVNFGKLKQLKPAVRLGHPRPDGVEQPRVGTVTKLFVGPGHDDEKPRLFAELSYVPKVVKDCIAQRLYTSCSAELLPNFRDETGPVFTGLALAGTSIPAVKDIADLGTYLDAQHEPGPELEGEQAERRVRPDEPQRITLTERLDRAERQLDAAKSRTAALIRRAERVRDLTQSETKIIAGRKVNMTQQQLNDDGSGRDLAETFRAAVEAKLNAARADDIELTATAAGQQVLRDWKSRPENAGYADALPVDVFKNIIAEVENGTQTSFAKRQPPVSGQVKTGGLGGQKPRTEAPVSLFGEVFGFDAMLADALGGVDKLRGLQAVAQRHRLDLTSQTERERALRLFFENEGADITRATSFEEAAHAWARDRGLRMAEADPRVMMAEVSKIRPDLVESYGRTPEVAAVPSQLASMFQHELAKTEKTDGHRIGIAMRRAVANAPRSFLPMYGSRSRS